MKKLSCGTCGFCRANYCRNPKSPRCDAVVNKSTAPCAEYQESRK